MTDKRVPREHNPPRAGARRRAAQGDVAGYIHELSDRHGHPGPMDDADPAATPDAECDDA